MSAITQEELDEAVGHAATRVLTASHFAFLHKDVEILIRAFFDALPADVKLMRREPTHLMSAKGLTIDEYEQDPAEVWRAMHDVAPPSLPKEGES